LGTFSQDAPGQPEVSLIALMRLLFSEDGVDTAFKLAQTAENSLRRA
jgi:hypothetical protein